MVRWFCVHRKRSIFRSICEFSISIANLYSIEWWRSRRTKKRKNRVCVHLKLVEIWFLLSISCWQTWYANNKWCWQNVNRVYSAFISISNVKGQCEICLWFWAHVNINSVVSWFENFISIYVFRWKSIMSTLINPIA